jgi:hypothetical protein
LRLAVTLEADHVRELVRPIARAERRFVLLQALNDEPSLFLALKEGHLDVVNALLEAGGRELLMLTVDDGVCFHSPHYICPLLQASEHIPFPS